MKIESIFLPAMPYPEWELFPSKLQFCTHWNNRAQIISNFLSSLGSECISPVFTHWFQGNCFLRFVAKIPAPDLQERLLHNHGTIAEENDDSNSLFIFWFWSCYLKRCCSISESPDRLLAPHTFMDKCAVLKCVPWVLRQCKVCHWLLWRQNSNASATFRCDGDDEFPSQTMVDAFQITRA